MVCQCIHTSSISLQQLEKLVSTQVRFSGGAATEEGLHVLATDTKAAHNDGNYHALSRLGYTDMF